MRAEYTLSAQQKAEISEIDRQILVLQIRKAEIYAVAPVKYITENPEDAKAVERAMKVYAYLHDEPLIPKEEIAVLMKGESSEMGMTIKEYAKMLNGREYGYPQFTKEEIEIAKQNGFVIVYGASDDLMEFDGALHDEAGCFDGGTVYLCESGVVDDDSAATKSIDAAWCDKERTDENGNIITWTYKTDIPHETFMIYDDGEPYCEAIVFHGDDIK